MEVWRSPPVAAGRAFSAIFPSPLYAGTALLSLEAVLYWKKISLFPRDGGEKGEPMKRLCIFFVACAAMLSFSSCAAGQTRPAPASGTETTEAAGPQTNPPEPMGEPAAQSAPAETSSAPLSKTEAVTQYWEERDDTVLLTNVPATLPSVSVRKGDTFLGLRVDDLYHFRKYSGTPEHPVLDRTGVRVFFSGELTLTGKVSYSLNTLEETPIFVPDSESLEKIPSFPPEFSDVLTISLTGADELSQAMRAELVPSSEEGLPQEEVIWPDCTLTLRRYTLNHVEEVGGMHTGELAELKRHGENAAVFTGAAEPQASSVHS